MIGLMIGLMIGPAGSASHKTVPETGAVRDALEEKGYVQSLRYYGRPGQKIRRADPSNPVIEPVTPSRDATVSHAVGYATRSAKSRLGPFEFERREPGPRDVQIEILFSGVCHSDIHQARDEWGGSIYPMVPGHEIAGRVTHVGAAVRKFKVGDLAGVGCMVDSCRECGSCRDGEEQYCERGMTVFTYNGRFHDGMPTYGGYSGHIVVDEAFVLRISPKLDLAAVAPLPVCGDHDLFADEALGRAAGAAGRCDRIGRPWPHGAQVRTRFRRARDPVHDDAGQGGGCAAARRRRGRRDAGLRCARTAQGQLSLPDRHRVRRSRSQRLPEAPPSRIAPWCWSGRPSIRRRWRHFR